MVDPNKLTPAQTEVLRLVACGLPQHQIAKLRGVRPKTVRNQMTLVLCKIGATSSLQAALYAWRNGVISIDEAWDTLCEVQGN